MKIDIDDLELFMLNRKLKYFEIRTLTTNELVFDQEDDITVEEAVAVLRDFMQRARGKLKIKLTDKSKSQKASGGNIRGNIYNYEIDGLVQDERTTPVRETGATSQSVGIFGGMQPVIEMLKEQFKVQTEAIRRENELQRSIDELKTKMDNRTAWWENFLDKHGHTVFNRIAGAWFPQQTPVTITGGGAGPVENNPNSNLNSVNDSLRRMAAVDADYVNTLKLIADFCEKFPGAIPDMKQQIMDTLNSVNPQS